MIKYKTIRSYLCDKHGLLTIAMHVNKKVYCACCLNEKLIEYFGLDELTEFDEVEVMEREDES